MNICFDGAQQACKKSGHIKPVPSERFFRRRVFIDNKALWLPSHAYERLLALAKHAVKTGTTTVQVASVNTIGYGVMTPTTTRLMQQGIAQSAVRCGILHPSMFGGTQDNCAVWVWRAPLANIDVSEPSKGRVLAGVNTPTVRQLRERTREVTPPRKCTAYTAGDLQHATPEQLTRRVNNILNGSHQLCEVR